MSTPNPVAALPSAHRPVAQLILGRARNEVVAVIDPARPVRAGDSPASRP